jgi:hypothetical protein
VLETCERRLIRVEWERRLAEWRRNPTTVLRCPACNALHGLHRIECELR